MALSNFQVLQRDSQNKARVITNDGTALELAAGGPYQVDDVTNILVGDIWMLAGQSNMEGCGNLHNTETSTPLVHCFEMREEWTIATEPLHWLGESPRLVHSTLWGRPGVIDTPAQRDPNRTKGAGCGLSFAKKRLDTTGVPIGLVASAHGGTSMEQWSPSLRDQNGASLYGATIERIKGVGGTVAGVLWYQGESDCNPEAASIYKERMVRLVESFRSDTGQPDLPFIYVQLGRWVANADEPSIRSWNAVREIQRTLIHDIPNTYMVSAIDLDLDDGIHIGTNGLKRLGRRLADAAAGIRAPELAHVTAEDGGSTIRVTYRNVRGELRTPQLAHGYSLHTPDGAEIKTIFKIEPQGSTVLLRVDNVDAAKSAVLFYGYGTDPICNITDSEDAAIPAFGPVHIAF